VFGASSLDCNRIRQAVEHAWKGALLPKTAIAELVYGTGSITEEGEYASVKSLLCESKSSGKMTWRGSGKGTVKQSERSELCKKQHLPQAIHVLIKQGLP